MTNTQQKTAETCEWCSKELKEDKPAVYISKYDHADEVHPLIGHYIGFHEKCFSENVAGLDYNFDETIEKKDIGQVAKECFCLKRADEAGVFIAKLTAKRDDMVWVQFTHEDCFKERAGKDFLKKLG